ncbi:MAG TPA: hypothetical protein VI381_04800 [Allosphingosinicella sp.]
MTARPSLFQRFLLPGFAFKAVVIGGGYATGRELVEFFVPSGPVGGLMGMLLAACLWSLICALTFAYARMIGSEDYRSFFKSLLGPFWVIFEVAYIGFLILILSVFGAAAGEIAAAIGLPNLAGTLALAAAIAGFTAFGNRAVEQLFKYVSYLLYGVYVLLIIIVALRFGDRIGAAFAAAPPGSGWAMGGLTYAGYNIIGAVVILPVVRHFTSQKDALVAGLLAGPLAILPAILFFICMAAFQAEIADQALPSDYLLAQLGLPAFRLLFQLMIFSALLESGAGIVNAVNERLAGLAEQRGRTFTPAMRLGASLSLLVIAIFVAGRFGLIALIAEGYPLLALTFLILYIAPLLTLGVWRLGIARRRSDMDEIPSLTVF